MLPPGKRSYNKPRQNIKKQRHHFAYKGSHSQGYCFSSSHVQMWTLNHKERKAEYQRTDAFELWCWRRHLKVPWTARRSNQLILKKSILKIHWKNQCWSWSSNTLATWLKTQLIGKDPDAGKDWRQEEKGTTEDEMVGWHCRLSGHEFEQTLGDGEGQGSLVCCHSRGCNESDMT